MNCDLSKHLYQLLSFKLKNFAPLSASIKGDLNRYKDLLSNFKNTNYFLREINFNTDDGKKMRAHFTDKNEMFVEVFDNQGSFNCIQIYISDNRNRVEFIASKMNLDTNEPVIIEDSEYLYEPDTGRCYIYHSQRSFVTNEELVAIHTYDKHGDEEKRNMYYRNFKQERSKTKVLQ